MKRIILVAETGSDISPELAERYGIRLVPMHVTFGDVTEDDGTFPPERIEAYYRETGNLPKTSGSTPGDFETVFDRIHAEDPEAEILYLAYSAVTTCSYQSAMIAAEGRDYVTALDTRQVSVGQAAVVVEVAEFLEKHPEVTVSEAAKAAEEIISRAKMCFLPDNLEFLRAGGRVSNVTFLGSRILSLHPTIEILDGKLVATKKYRGRMQKVAVQLIQDYAETYRLKKNRLWLIWIAGFSDEVRSCVEKAIKECGFQEACWIKANGVITTHGGPAAFGLAGFSEEE